MTHILQAVKIYGTLYGTIYGKLYSGIGKCAKTRKRTLKTHFRLASFRK